MFKIGQKYLIPHLEVIKYIKIEDFDFEINENGELNEIKFENLKPEKHYFPIYHLLHNDLKTGQKEYHYHGDSRFGEGQRFRVDKNNHNILYKESICIREHENNSTSFTEEIAVKLKCDKLRKGNKCPHKGYNLNNEIPDFEGNIKCPLHGLKFNIKSKKRIPIETLSQNEI